LPRAYVDRYLNDAWLARNARWGPSRFSYRALNEASTAREFANAWQLENPRWRTIVRHNGRRLHYINYEALSIEDECAVDVIELRSPRDLRLGWVFLHHLRADQVTIAKEFFVWPPFRRQGYGTLLEEAAVERARQIGSSHLRLTFYGADAIPRSRAAGRMFVATSGYRWHWRHETRPDRAGFAEKAVNAAT
jgi:GNAT superfamily N-acetyltransferase